MRSSVGLAVLCVITIIYCSKAQEVTQTYIIKIQSNMNITNVDIQGVPMVETPPNTVALPLVQNPVQEQQTVTTIVPPKVPLKTADSEGEN